jgi:hypothetical protein
LALVAYLQEYEEVDKAKVAKRGGRYSMKRFIVISTIILCGLGLLAILLEAEQRLKATREQKFVFRYKINEPMVYSMGMKMRIDMQDEVNNKTTTTTELRYQFKLTPLRASEDEITTMRLEPLDLEGYFDIFSPVGHIALFFRGSEIKGTVNGVPIIDTEKGIGVAEAEEFKKKILPFHLNGEIDIDSKGYVKGLRGDSPFVEFWKEVVDQHKSLFSIVFPDRAIAIGDTWTETITRKKLGEIELVGKELRCTVTFTRLPDITTQRKRLAVFSLSASCSAEGLTGLMEHEGEIIRVHISHLDLTTSGTIHFDKDKGILIDETMKEIAVMNISMQNQVTKMSLSTESTINLINN